MKENKWIHSYYNFQETNYRVYDSTHPSLEEIFQNEIGVLFEIMFNKNLDIYLFSTLPNHKINFSEKDIKYINTDCVTNTKLINNVNLIKDLQSEDLLKFYDLLHCDCFFVLSTFRNDYYCFDLLLATNKKFDLNKFLTTKFNIIKIDSFKKFKKNDFNFIYFKKLLNFDFLDKCKFNLLNDYKNIEFGNKLTNSKIEKAREILNDFLKNQYELYGLSTSDLQNTNNNTYIELLNNLHGLQSEIIDQRLNCKNLFKNLGWAIYVLNYNFIDFETFQNQDNKYSIPINPTILYLLDKEEQHNFNLINLKNGSIESIIEQFDWSCMFDLVDDLNSFFYSIFSDKKYYFIDLSIISIPKIKYNSFYRQNLINQNIKIN